MAYKAGWEDAGNGFVKNSSTGQMLQTNNDLYRSQWDDSYGSPAGAAAPAATAPSGPITTQGQVAGTTAKVGQTAAPGQATTVAQSFQQALVNRLNPQAVSAQSASVAPAIAANKLTEQRGLESNQNALAERAAATGTNMSGGFESQLLGLKQDSAGRHANFVGNAVQRANELENQNMTSSLGMVGSLLGGQASLAQQQQLADLDAQLRREGLAQQGELGRGDLALRGRLGEGQLSLGLLSALLGHDQFGRSLSQQGAQFGQSLDQQGLLALLGGL
jgi:hypothetical protein